MNAAFRWLYGILLWSAPFSAHTFLTFATNPYRERAGPFTTKAREPLYKEMLEVVAGGLRRSALNGGIGGQLEEAGVNARLWKMIGEVEDDKQLNTSQKKVGGVQSEIVHKDADKMQLGRETTPQHLEPLQNRTRT